MFKLKFHQIFNCPVFNLICKLTMMSLKNSKNANQSSTLQQYRKCSSKIKYYLKYLCDRCRILQRFGHKKVFLQRREIIQLLLQRGDKSVHTLRCFPIDPRKPFTIENIVLVKKCDHKNFLRRLQSENIDDYLQLHKTKLGC